MLSIGPHGHQAREHVWVTEEPESKKRGVRQECKYAHQRVQSGSFSNFYVAFFFITRRKIFRPNQAYIAM